MQKKTYSVIGNYVLGESEMTAFDLSKIMTANVENIGRNPREGETKDPTRGTQVDHEFSSWFVSLNPGIKGQDFQLSEHDTEQEAKRALRNFLIELSINDTSA